MTGVRVGFGCAAMVGLMALLPACQSESLPPNVDQRLGYVQTEIGLGRESTVWAANSLRKVQEANAEELPGAISNFHQAVTGLYEKAGGVGMVLNATESRADNYFEKWQKEIGTIEDPELRAKSSDRRAAMSAKYQDVDARMNQLRGSFKPFMGKLQDIDRSLAADPSPNGQKAASATIREALDQEKPVLQDIDALDKSVSKLRGKWSL